LPDNLIDDVVSDCQTFLTSRKKYEEMAMPYRRGYLLYGEPGCGKSSFIFALASHLNIPICILDLTGEQGRLNDSALQVLINSAPAGSIVLIEEVDTLFLSGDAKNDDDDDDEYAPALRGPRRVSLRPPMQQQATAAAAPLVTVPAAPAMMAAEQLSAFCDLLDKCSAALAVKHMDLGARLDKLATIIKEADVSGDTVPVSGSSGGKAMRTRSADKAPVSALSSEKTQSNEPGRAPLNKTAEWLEFMETLEQAGFDRKSARFSQPLRELQELQFALGASTLSLAVTVDNARLLRQTFAAVDAAALVAKCGGLRSKAAAKLARASDEFEAPAGSNPTRSVLQPDTSDKRPLKPFRKPAKNCVCSFAGLLQALDGVTAQEGRLVFFTTNHKEKLDEALIRPGRMDRHIEFKVAGVQEICAQFVRFFEKAERVVNERGDRALPSAAMVKAHAASFEELLNRVLECRPGFKMPTLAMTQVFFQSKFREAEPMQAALDGFGEFFKCEDLDSDVVAPLRPSESVDFQALTRQSSLGRCSSAPARQQTCRR
jgi:SpoVK/Ycf46/Vps4 family AAA+-type ATPase